MRGKRGKKRKSVREKRREIERGGRERKREREKGGEKDKLCLSKQKIPTLKSGMASLLSFRVDFLFQSTAKKG